MASTPFRFGIQTYGAVTGADWSDKARRAEAQGFDVLLIADHLKMHLSPFAALAAAAAATSTLRVGTLVLNSAFRHPLVAAREYASVDVLSNGRVEVGLGTGWFEEEYRQAGLAFDEPVLRAERLDETVRIFKEFFADENVSFAGKHFSIADAPAIPRPVQQPRPPILVGGGSLATLAFAAREADIVNMWATTKGGRLLPPGETLSVEATNQRLAVIRGASADRQEPVELSIYVQYAELTDSRLARSRQIAAENGLTAADVLESPYLIVGSVSEVEALLRERRDESGISYIIVHEDYAPALVPVIERLKGT
jgi:probable F420-dependent oxidoreductase